MDMPAVASIDKYTRGSGYGGYDDGCRTSIDQTTTRKFVITKLRSNKDEDARCYNFQRNVQKI